MERWVNDYKIVERVFFGYKPVLPLQVREAGSKAENYSRTISAILMGMPDEDYATAQELKQIYNDLSTLETCKGVSLFPDVEVKNLEEYTNKVCKTKLSQMSKLDLFKLFFRKLFRK